ncbi:TRAP transporter substrate-binding protein [Microbacterium sp. NPDC078428]|uniref:TRAP transporter substrate-binding protein n=1 Tax=Microbacterium sp. NPDC078428 TaxID=3364190 RepID=UPI0037CC4097
MNHQKMRKRRALAAAGLGSVLVLLSGCSATVEETKPEFTLVVAHEVPTDHYYHETYLLFEELVEERSNGRIEVKVVPNALFGTADALTTAVQLDSIQMTATTSGILGQFSPEQNVWDTPYLFDDPDHAHRVLDGEFGQEVLAELEHIDLVGLGYLENGVRHLTTRGIEVDGPDDLNRVKIRVQPNTLQLEAWDATQANPTPMAFGEVYTGLQQRTIDAQENPLALIVSQRFYEVQDRVTLTAHVHSTSTLVLSKIFYDRLPEDLQQVVVESAQESVEFNRIRAAESDIESAKIIEEAGVTIAEISDEGREEFREAMQGAALPYLRKTVGDETVDRLEAAIEEERQ